MLAVAFAKTRHIFLEYQIIQIFQKRCGEEEIILVGISYSYIMEQSVKCSQIVNIKYNLKKKLKLLSELLWFWLLGPRYIGLISPVLRRHLSV